MTGKRLYGLPHLRWHHTDGGLDSDGQPKLADCNVFGTRAVVMTAGPGFTNVTRGRGKLERDPRFHRHVMISDDGKEEWASHTNSVQWLGGVMHQEARERRLANLAVNPQPLETRVLREQQESRGALGGPQVWHVSRPALPTGTPFRAARPRRVLSSLERAAFHQAGHAVAAVLHRRGLRKITIVPDKDSGIFGCAFTGRFGGLFYEAHVGRKQHELMVSLAGREADALASGRRNPAGARGVNQYSCDLLDYRCCGDPRKLQPYVDLLFVRTEAMFLEDANWRAVEALVEALLRHKTIGARRAREIILEARRSSPAAVTRKGQGQALRVALHGPTDPSSGSNLVR